jgi:cytochrome c-type biogenesis protein CcmF
LNKSDAILYISIALGAAIISLLAYQLLKKTDRFERYIRWLVRAFCGLLVFDFVVLLFYFHISNFTVQYVWQFSSKYYPVLYRLSGALAGQTGTLLFWAALISVGALWLNETKGSETSFVKKSLIIVVFLTMYFTLLTVVDSPFKTIYADNPDLLAANNPNIVEDFIPDDGNGLNPLLIDPWMATHPFTTFLGYAGTTVPFAGAIVFLFSTFLGGSGAAANRMWVDKGIQWLRVSWLFSTVSMVFGGIWAYKSLGWGGFWAWDPVETAMLLPWLMLTAAIHTVIEHRKDGRKYTILAPVLTAFTFSMVVYATMVTRSGIFESVHAFIAGAAGKYIIILATASFAVPLALGSIKYIKSDVTEAEEKFLINRTNIFYAAILVLLIITFISFFGITYPPIAKKLYGIKYSVTAQFFNLWIYPFFIFMLLLIGLGLQYRPSIRKEALKTFLLFTVLTLVAAAIRPNENFNIIDYTGIVTAEKPLLYAVIGGASALSVIPPSIYIVYAVEQRWKAKFSSLKKRHLKIKEAGILTIHIGVVLIGIGAVYASLFVSDFSGNMDINKPDVRVPMSPASSHEGFGRLGTWGVHPGEGESPYSVQLIEYKKVEDFGAGKKKEVPPPPGLSIGEFYNELKSGEIKDSYTVRGFIEDVTHTEHITYIKLKDGQDVLWVAIDRIENMPTDITVVATGTIMFNFLSPSLGKTFDWIMFSTLIEEYSPDTLKSPYKTVEQLHLAVYKHDQRIGHGIAKREIFKNGDANRVMVDRSLTDDVFVSFSGLNGNSAPVSVKIKPLMNWIWIGSIFLVIGITMTIFSDRE